MLILGLNMRRSGEQGIRTLNRLPGNSVPVSLLTIRLLSDFLRSVGSNWHGTASHSLPLPNEMQSYIIISIHPSQTRPATMGFAVALVT